MSDNRKKIGFRVDAKIETKLINEAEKYGLSLSAYLERIAVLREHVWPHIEEDQLARDSDSNNVIKAEKPAHPRPANAEQYESRNLGHLVYVLNEIFKNFPVPEGYDSHDEFIKTVRQSALESRLTMEERVLN